MDLHAELLKDRREISVGNRKVGDGHPVFVIAEIGINHNGDLDIARKLIDAAEASGCDAVKFQKRTLEVVYAKEELDRSRESPFGATNGDLKRGLEFGREQYREIDRYCKELGILWTASCWDEASVDFLEQFKPSFYKVASASLTDTNLLRHTRKTGKPIVLSTGMSTLEEIDQAVKVLGDRNLAILHCTSTYPSDPMELNLRTLFSLRDRFRCPIGYSGHEVGLLPTVVAVTLGASIVERHITLDRAMWGSDQAASIEIPGLQRLVRDIRLLPVILGDGIKQRYPSEEPIRKKLRRIDSMTVK